MTSVVPSDGTITWVNHFSVVQCLKERVRLESFTCVGLDGFFLRLIFGQQVHHTSADHSLPKWIADRELKVGLIGGTAKTCKEHREDFQMRFPNCEVIWSLPGSSNWRESLKPFLEDENEKPNLIIVGMGAPLQERVSQEVYVKFKESRPGENLLVATCGGWLDQLKFSNYYPSWSLKFRLNWLVRFYREPKRLWKRYLIYPFVALAKRKSIRNYLSSANLLLTENLDP